MQHLLESLGFVRKSKYDELERKYTRLTTLYIDLRTSIDKVIHEGGQRSRVLAARARSQKEGAE